MSDRPTGPLGVDPLQYVCVVFGLLICWVAYLLLPKGMRQQHFGAYPKRFRWSARPRSKRGNANGSGSGGGRGQVSSLSPRTSRGKGRSRDGQSIRIGRSVSFFFFVFQINIGVMQEAFFSYCKFAISPNIEHPGPTPIHHACKLL
jgi:hypothetical protein